MSESNLTYFLHIPKTAGTSLAEYLLEVGGPESVPPPMLWDHLVKGHFTVTPQTRIIIGHFGGLLPLWLRQWPRIITILRDPVARALSHYNHVQREPGHPWHTEASTLSLIQYCEHPIFRRSVENIQSRQLASLAFTLALLPTAPERVGQEPLGNVSIAFEDSLFSLDRAGGLLEAAIHAVRVIDAVGIAEAHDSSLQLFARKLNWPEPVGEYRKNLSTPGQKKMGSLPPQELAVLTSLNEVDIRLYQFALKRFHEDCHGNGIELDTSFHEWTEQFKAA